MMSIARTILLFFAPFVLSSCAIKNFYQVYQVQTTPDIVSQQSQLVYEDENCIVSYNLWGNGGNIGFQFYNKTDKDILLNLGESFFILNGVAFDYYKNRVFTQSASSGASNSRSNSATRAIMGVNYSNLLQTNVNQTTVNSTSVTSSGYSVAYSESKILCIPSKTARKVSEYDINNALYRDCDLLKYPSANQIKSKSFSKSDSPLVFSNLIAYAVGDSSNFKRFENEFFVSEITNFSESAMMKSGYAVFCGQKSISTLKSFKNISPDKFYIKYVKGADTWKH
jgi:hypothetical protein